MSDLEILERGIALDGTQRANPLSASFASSYAGIMAFVAVASEGNFAKAAQRLGIGRSAVSRNVSKLEAQLNTRLFLRTTRTTMLTREGQRFYDNCHLGVTHIVDAMREMIDLRTGPPSGLVRISSSLCFGRRIVAPLLERFSKIHPGIDLELLLDDRPTDFVSDDIDVAFRNGRIEDSAIVGKLLVPMQMIVVASPSYAQAYGLPKTPDDLAAHQCISYRFWHGRLFEWEFNVDGQLRKYLPAPRRTFNDFELVLDAVLQGQGIAQTAGYLVREHIAAGQLVMAMPSYAPSDRGHYLCYLSRQHLPARIRVFIDFMTDAIRALDFRCDGDAMT